MSALDDYLAAGMAIFPVNARGAPLTQHGVKDASSDPEVIRAWRERWPGCDFGWAVPADVVVVDLDEKHGKHGLRDFRRAPDAIRTMSPHPRPRRRAAVCTSSIGRRNRTKIWLPRSRGPASTPAPPAATSWRRWKATAGMAASAHRRGRRYGPALASAGVARLRAAKEPSPRAPLVLAPRSALAPPSADPWAQRKALGEFEGLRSKSGPRPPAPRTPPDTPNALHRRDHRPRRYWV